MHRTRWLITIALGLAPMLGGMALQRPGGGAYFSASAAVGSSASPGGKSGGNNSSANSPANNSSNSSSSSSGSSSSSAVSVGVAPRAKVTNPHGPLSTPCANCHTYTSWKPIRSKPDFNHDLTGYPLRGMHQNVACNQCHTSMMFKNVASQCADCHADIHHRQFGANCSQCHSVKGWQVSLQAIQNHSNRFPLVGAHSLVQCEECHKQAAVGQFRGLSTSCYSCHQKDFLTPVVDHVGLGFPTTCDSCHSLNSWFNAKFDHLKYTGYALTGAHATLDCTACHANNVFKGTPAQCYGCHAADYKSSNNPPHAQVGFPQGCQLCHTTTDWTVTTFDHATYAHWPLTGKHATTTCVQCHQNNSYVNTSTDCYSCHKADYQGTTSPNHAQVGYPTSCQTCHNTTNWTSATTFDHSSTGFPLTGAHATVPCAQCHVNNNFNLTSAQATCINCHSKDYNGTSDPPHAGALAAMFPTASCQTCHNTTAWTGATFNHDSTGFSLTGAHQAVACSACHVSNNYTLNSANTACVSCHLKDFNGATNPNHVQSKFPQTCETCHNTVSWTGAGFNHNNTGFPLTGAHTTVPCLSCHVNNNYNLTSANTACVSCHLTDFQGTTNPNHVQANYPQTCQTCHNTTSWTNATFDHSTTGFPLTGAHTTVACALCHVSNNYNLTSANTACVSCHLTDFQGTTNPNHVQAKYPQTCQNCHSTTSWLNATFDHSTTGFPLTGAHTSLQCVQCHVNNNYSLTSAQATCANCHMTDYNGTTNPNHAAAKYPTTCDTCHSTTNWTSATFNHASTGFALTGFHATMPCAQCHVNNNYNLTPAQATCINCHQTDYNGTTNPPHASAGFPTDCTVCHSTTNWTSATFNHTSTGFALTGFHATMQCVQCHTNNNYKLGAMTCDNCHHQDYLGTTNPNHVTSNFPTTCDACHTTTSWAGANFNHNNTGFPLTGFHTTVPCASCHINNNYSLGAMTCDNCHDADFMGTTNPNHTTAGWPKTCDTCHTTTAWLPANLPTSYHTFFPPNHGNANSVCATCHTNSSDYSIFQCTGCHGNNNAANFHHPNVGNYQYLSTACYSCHKSGGGG